MVNFPQFYTTCTPQINLLHLIHASRNLQNHLSLIEKWYTNWRLSQYDQDKSYHTKFTIKVSQRYFSWNPLLRVRRLTWTLHIKSKRVELNNRLRILNTLQHKNTHTNLKIKLVTYKTYLDLQLYCNANKSNIKKILTFHNILLRKVTNSLFRILNFRRILLLFIIHY